MYRFRPPTTHTQARAHIRTHTHTHTHSAGSCVQLISFWHLMVLAKRSGMCSRSSTHAVAAGDSTERRGFTASGSLLRRNDDTSLKKITTDHGPNGPLSPPPWGLVKLGLILVSLWIPFCISGDAEPGGGGWYVWLSHPQRCAAVSHFRAWPGPLLLDS